MANDTLSNQLADAFGKPRIEKTKNKKDNRYGILKKYRYYDMEVVQSARDGEDHINVSMTSRKKLGRFLSTEFIHEIATPLGKFSSLDLFMRYINTPKMPFTFNNPRSAKDYYKKYKKMGLKTISIPNYWALVMAGFICKITSNKRMMKALEESTLPLTSYHYEKQKNNALGQSGPSVIVHHYYRSKYIGIIMEVRDVLKKFSDPELRRINFLKLIQMSKDAPDKHLYEGIPFITEQDLDTVETSLEELEKMEEARLEEIENEKAEALMKEAEEAFYNEQLSDASEGESDQPADATTSSEQEVPVSEEPETQSEEVVAQTNEETGETDTEQSATDVTDTDSIDSVTSADADLQEEQESVGVATAYATDPVVPMSEVSGEDNIYALAP